MTKRNERMYWVVGLKGKAVCCGPLAISLVLCLIFVISVSWALGLGKGLKPIYLIKIYLDIC